MKADVIKNYPNAKCIWRDGARISYEIWDGKIKLSTCFVLTAREAWASVIL